MATKRLPRPRDPAQLAKLIVDIATGAVEDRVDNRKSAVAVERGRKGGAKGGASALNALHQTNAANLQEKQRKRVGKVED